jgi:hypothetical protein
MYIYEKYLVQWMALLYFRGKKQAVPYCIILIFQKFKDVTMKTDWTALLQLVVSQFLQLGIFHATSP